MHIEEALASAGMERLDAEILLAHVLHHDRTWILAHANDSLSEADVSMYQSLVYRRKGGEPIAYIIGEKEFYGRRFIVRSDVLIPRPCTEELVTTSLLLLDGKTVEPIRTIDEGIVCVSRIFGKLDDVRTIVDIGTGSGCIGITLACERSDLRCIATDPSIIALETAQENAHRLHVADRMKFLQGAFLEPLQDLAEPFLLTTNPPYVADAALLEDDVRSHEPDEALMGGGSDGGDILREIVQQAKHHPWCRGMVAECLSEQASIVVG